MTYGQAGSVDATTDGKPVTLKEEWQISDRDTVRPGEFPSSFLQREIQTILFNRLDGNFQSRR